MGLGLIAAFAVLLFVVLPVIGQDISPMILVSAFILVSVYVVLSFEFFHRSSVAPVGPISLVFGSIDAEESFEFIVGVIDYNTIGLLLGMMIIVAIFAESGVFQ